MPKLTMEEKLEIANSGGQFQEEGANSWVGTKIRKGRRHGVVIQDLNGAWRILTVLFKDGAEEEIEMNNIGPSPEYIHQFEFQTKEEQWYRF